MKKTILLLFFGMTTVNVNAQKTKLLLAEKVRYEEKKVIDNIKTDQELKEEMTTFFGFGIRLSIKGVEEPVQVNDGKKRKSALRIQLGFQMPKYINTRPPEKFFKTGWDLGILR